jgi:coenzyme F420-reducing hydrogenase delta subunit
MIAEWDKDQGKWILKGTKNVKDSTAKEFFEENSTRLLKNNAIQNNVDGVYVIPLKSKECSAIIGIYAPKTQADPEWYKLLNMLQITSIEGLENASIKSTNYCKTNKDCKFPALVKELYSKLDELKKEYKSDKAIQNFIKEVDGVIKSLKTRETVLKDS